MNTNRKCIAKRANKAGKVFALVKGDSSFEVLALCENYSGQVRGGMSRQWRHVAKGMTQEAAQALFNRRAA
jgi:hypothetical protein